MIKKIIMYIILSVIAIIPSAIGMDFNTSILNILCVMPIILFGIYEMIQNYKKDNTQKVINRWGAYIQYNLQHKNDEGFEPYSDLINKFTLKEMELLEKNECYLIDMGKDYAIIYLASDVFKHLFEIYFERLDNKEERSNIIIVKPNTL